MAREPFSWMNPKLEIREAKKYGRALTARKSGLSKAYHEIGFYSKGVFAKETLRNGERLAIFAGKLVLVNEEIDDYGIQIDEDFVINAFDKETQEIEDAFHFTPANLMPA